MFIYARLNEMVKERGVSKAHLCRLLGKSPYYLRDAEKAKQDIKGRSLEIIADALHVNKEYLTGETDVKSVLIYQDRDERHPLTIPENEKQPSAEDEELQELLERARDDPDIRMLFSVTRDATPEDIQKAIKIIQMLKGE